MTRTELTEALKVEIHYTEKIETLLIKKVDRFNTVTSLLDQKKHLRTLSRSVKEALESEQHHLRGFIQELKDLTFEKE
jgi:hypothetical protein